MRYFKRIAAVLLCMSLLSGCTVLNSGDDLLQTPRAAKSFLLLQKQLDSLGDNMTSISPQSGQYRNTVTFEDLDGDGTDEAIATMRQGTGGQILVYAFKLVDDNYEQIGCITGQGTAIGSLSFLSLNADGTDKGMIITWTLSNSVEQGMSVCALHDGTMQSLLDLEYTDYTTGDLDGDKIDELLTVNYAEKSRKSAQLYDYQDGSMALKSQTDATQNVQSVANITIGSLESGEKAVFVDNKLEKDNGMETDVYAVSDGTLENLALTSGFSTYRAISLYYSDDVNGDGKVEVPILTALPGYEDSAQVDTLWSIDWYDFSLQGNKEQERVFTTYHSLNEEWRLIFPEGWRGNVTAVTTGDSDVSQTIFSDAATSDVLLTIYVFGGSDRKTAASSGGLIDLGSLSSNYYAAKINRTDSEYAITEGTVEKNFAIIQSDWY